MGVDWFGVIIVVALRMIVAQTEPRCCPEKVAQPYEGGGHEGQYDLSRLAASLAVRNTLAMTRPATVEAMDCLDAYYKVGTTTLA